MTNPSHGGEHGDRRGTLASITDTLPAIVAYVTSDQTYAAANRAFTEWLQVDPVGRRVPEVLGPAAYETVRPHLARALAGERVTSEMRVPFPSGEREVEATYIPDRGPDGITRGVVVFVTDIGERKRLEHELREQAASSATLARVSQALSSELDLQQLLQVVTDGATELAQAQFGAFFYNVTGAGGDAYTLYTISGVEREAFSTFPMPRNTRIFDPTFRGAGVVRFDDVTAAPEFGHNPPYHGMAPGHLPVCSYLAVPVLSSTGVVLGGLFFGHERRGVFTERTEALLTALAAQAGVAIDNARLVAALRRERSQAEDAGRRYRFLSEIVPQLLWTADPSGAVDYVNARWIEFTALDLEASAGSGWHAAVHPEDLVRTRHAWEQAVADGAPYEATVRMRRAQDGCFRWMLNRAYPLRDDGGTILRWFGSCTDIHEQKRHEDSQHLLSEASRVLADSLDIDQTLSTVAALVAAWFRGYCIIDLLVGAGLQRVATAHVDPQGQALVDELRQYPPAEDHRNPIWRALDSRRPVFCDRVTDELLADAAQSPRHVAVRSQLGTTGYMIVPLLAGGRTVGTIMLATTTPDGLQEEDVRPIEELAYRIAIAVTNARAFQEVREANRLKDEFLAIVSHELRTPLNAMRGWTALLRSKRLTPEQETQAVEVIERNIHAQAQLVDDLLDISRIVSGRMRLALVPTDLCGVVEAAIESVAPAASARGIRLESSVDPPTCQAAADPDRLQQVVWNLLSNAIKFTGRGGRVRVAVRATEQIEIVVSDTGQGISAEFLPHVFDRFRQADSTTTRLVGGLGLGLAIVRHLVELHGGTVAAASPGEGQGATFTVCIPRLFP